MVCGFIVKIVPIFDWSCEKKLNRFSLGWGTHWAELLDKEEKHLSKRGSSMVFIVDSRYRTADLQIDLEQKKIYETHQSRFIVDGEIYDSLSRLLVDFPAVISAGMACRQAHTALSERIRKRSPSVLSQRGELVFNASERACCASGISS